MALSDIEKVYREAVDMIGEITITDTSNQDIKPYSTCDYHYEQARDEMIRGYAWNEATKLGLCLESLDKPAHTWTFKFTLPSDYLRPLHTTKPREDWRVLGGFIYANYKMTPESYTIGTDYYVGHYLSHEDVTYKIDIAFTATTWAGDSGNCTSQIGDYGYIELEYVKSLPTVADWSVNLRQAVILNLAAKIAVPITSSHELRTELLKELHQLVLPHAWVLDAMTGKPKQMFYSEHTDSRGRNI